MQFNTTKTSFTYFVVVFSFLFLSSTQNTSSQTGARIAVIKSFNSKPFEEALSGFKQHLEKEGITANLIIFQLDGNAVKAEKAVQEVKNGGFSLLFTMGSLATDNVLNEINEIPIISTMILKEEKIKKKQNATGVVLEFPIETQLKYLQQILSKNITIGTIYNARENGKFIENASFVAQTMGFKFYTREISAPQDLPSALESMANTVDVILGIPDSVVITPETSKHILLFSLRNKIPFIGLSDAWTKAGALYSLERDYVDIGTQCGELAVRLLRNPGERAANPATPRKAIYSLNLKTAKQLKIDIPENIINRAIQIF